MTLQELGHIDELIAWLDNEQDGAEDAGFVARSATNWHPALVALRSEVEQLRVQLSAAHDVRDVFARDLNRMVDDCDKDTAAHDAIVASLTDELRRAKAKAEQYQIDWMAAKAEFGDKMAVLRQQGEMDERARQKAEQMAIAALAEKQQAEAAMAATLRTCPTCEGTGVMSVLVEVLPPDEREVYRDEQCAECGGHGLSSYGQMERDLAALRQRHAEAVEQTFREGRKSYHPMVTDDAAWLASEAKKGLA